MKCVTIIFNCFYRHTVCPGIDIKDSLLPWVGNFFLNGWRAEKDSDCACPTWQVWFCQVTSENYLHKVNPIFLLQYKNNYSRETVKWYLYSACRKVIFKYILGHLLNSMCKLRRAGRNKSKPALHFRHLQKLMLSPAACDKWVGAEVEAPALFKINHWTKCNSCDFVAFLT